MCWSGMGFHSNPPNTCGLMQIRLHPNKTSRISLTSYGWQWLLTGQAVSCQQAAESIRVIGEARATTRTTGWREDGTLLYFEPRFSLWFDLLLKRKICIIRSIQLCVSFTRGLVKRTGPSYTKHGCTVVTCEIVHAHYSNFKHIYGLQENMFGFVGCLSFQACFKWFVSGWIEASI